MKKYKIMRDLKTNNNPFFHRINIANLVNREYLNRSLQLIHNHNKTLRHKMNRIIIKISELRMIIKIRHDYIFIS